MTDAVQAPRSGSTGRHPTRRATLHLAAAMAGLALAWPSLAGVLGPGTDLPPLSLQDQHDKPVVIDAATRRVLFAPDRPSSELAQQALQAAGPDALGRAAAVYVADISAMPGFVTRMIALPKMREYPFRVALVREAGSVAAWPREAGAVTVLSLVQGRIVAVQHLRDAAALGAALNP